MLNRLVDAEHLTDINQYKVEIKEITTVSPTDNTVNQQKVEISYQNHQKKSWFSRKVRPIMHSTGEFMKDISGPIMTAGFLHECGRSFSDSYLHMVRRYPSGTAIFFAGFASWFLGE